MAKFLLAVLAAALLSGYAISEGVAGGEPPAPEPGIISRTTEAAWRIALRLKGVVLGSRVKKGMTPGQALDILGLPTRSFIGVGQCRDIYSELGLAVTISTYRPEGGGPALCVTEVAMLPLFK